MKSPRLVSAILLLLLSHIGYAQITTDKINKLKAEALAEIEKQYVLGQQINDMLFSFSELGFQEVETQTYLTSILEKNGFKIQKGLPDPQVAVHAVGIPATPF